MDRLAFVCAPARIILVLTAVIADVAVPVSNCRAQGGSTSVQQSIPRPELPPPAAQPAGKTVTVDQATLEQILARLAAAEAEIHSLRQQPATTLTPNADVHSEGTLPTPVAPPAVVAAPGCAATPPKAPDIHATSAKYLIPLSTKCGDITFKPGVRLQPRYVYDDFTDNNDFFINRVRLKSSGDIFKFAKYATEIKFDGDGKFETLPEGEVENAWIDFTVWPEETYLRVGLYDVPFSRDALTSDSKLLFMDRSLIKSALTTLGMADNGIGLMLHGRPGRGRLEYAVGIFDSVEFEEDGVTPRDSDQLMPIGRIAWNLLDPAEPADGYADYKGSYIGKGQRLAIGLNGATLAEATDGFDEFDVFAWGADVFFNNGPYTFQAEYDWFFEDKFGGAPSIRGRGAYVQAAYLINCNWEIAARFQFLDPDRFTFSDQKRWTSIGLNYYIWDHNLKIQTDYTFKDEQVDIANNTFQIQLQLDY